MATSFLKLSHFYSFPRVFKHSRKESSSSSSLLLFPTLSRNVCYLFDNLNGSVFFQRERGHYNSYHVLGRGGIIILPSLSLVFLTLDGGSALSLSAGRGSISSFLSLLLALKL